MRPPFLRVRRCLTQARLQEPCRTLSWDTNEQPRGARRSCLQTHWYRSCPKQFSPQAIARVLETAPIHAKPLLIKTDSKYAIQCSYPYFSSWSSMLTIVLPQVWKTGSQGGPATAFAHPTASRSKTAPSSAMSVLASPADALQASVSFSGTSSGTAATRGTMLRMRWLRRARVCPRWRSGIGRR
jgi:hypothetical protein